MSVVVRASGLLLYNGRLEACTTIKPNAFASSLLIVWIEAGILWPMQVQSPPSLETDSPATTAVESTVFSKITWLLLPFMFLLYVVGYLDRINVGFAALTMKPALHLSERAYGLGAGIFFLGYFLFEIPSNLILERIGARRWIARIMVSWGVIACAMMSIRGPISFNLLRFMLGAAEAGFFPGMVLYLTYWYPAARRAKAMSAFLTSTAIAGVAGAPVSWMCLKMNGMGQLAGWQWLFLLEGIPSVLLGFVVLYYLPDGPDQARWLSEEEKHWLRDHLETQRKTSADQHRHTFADALRDWRIWWLSGVYFFLVSGLYTFSLWAPAVLKMAAPGLTDARVVLLLAIPYSAASIGMILIGHHSDQTGERQWHIAIPAAIACVGAVGTAYVHTPGLAIGTLSLAALGIWGTLGTFWTLPTTFLRGSAAAGGIALVNSIGCLSGFVAPWLVGIVRERTGSFRGGLIGVGVSVLCGGLMVFRMSAPPREDHA